MTPTTQLAHIRAALERGEKLTPMDALRRWGCFRLGARIHELRQSGMHIVTTRVERGDARVAEYALVRKEAA